MNVRPKLPAVLLLCMMLGGCAASKAAPVQAPKVPSTGPAPVWVNDQRASAVTRSTGGLTISRLPNGMVVVVKEVHTSPVVDVRCYVHTGSMYEKEYMGTGISHLCEHLVAEGAEHDMGPGVTDKSAKVKVNRIVRIGGQSNAYTTLDHTCYYVSASATKAMDCVDLIADWMAKPEISKADFEREHGVVQRELEMGKDNPDRQLSYAGSANLFRNHPAGVPTIGYKAPLAALTYKDVLDYHARTYVPQNMVFVVTGDVRSAEVLSRIRADFASFLPARVPIPALPDVEPVAGVRRVVVPHGKVEEAIEEIYFPSITLFNNDLYPLDVLSTIVGEGQSSRLMTQIYRQRHLVTSIGSGSWTPSWGRGAFQVNFRCDPKLASQAEGAVLQELRQVALAGVDQKELERAKRQKIADFVYEQQTVSSQGATLGTDLMNTGNANFSRDYVQRIQRVTAEQVQAAAKKYLRPGSMVITRMVPEGKSSTGPATQPLAAQRKAQLFTLPNGLRVVLQPVPSDAGGLGLVSMVLVTKGGLMLETPQTNGLGNLMASLSTKGAGDWSAEQIGEFFDHAGGSISGSCGNNSTFWQATVLSDSFGRAMDIFAAVVQRPHLEAKELQTLRPGILAGIARIDSEPPSQMQTYFRRKFFAGTPYAMLPVGTAQVVRDATVQQLQQYHRDRLKAGASVLAVYGQFDPASARKDIERLFAAMPKGDLKIPSFGARKVKPGGELHVLPAQNEQATILIAVPGMTIFDLRDRFPIDVLKTIISGWGLPSGWLHDDLRGRQLVYSVGTYNWQGLIPGAYVAYAGCQPARAAQVIELIEKHLTKTTHYEFTKDQIDEAVNVILTAELLENQSVSSLAMSAALDELWGFGYDFRGKLEGLYRSVKPADLARVAAKYLGKDYVVCVSSPQPVKLTTQPASAPAASQEDEQK